MLHRRIMSPLLDYAGLFNSEIVVFEYWAHRPNAVIQFLYRNIWQWPACPSPLPSQFGPFNLKLSLNKIDSARRFGGDEILVYG